LEKKNGKKNFPPPPPFLKKIKLSATFPTLSDLALKEAIFGLYATAKSAVFFYKLPCKKLKYRSGCRKQMIGIFIQSGLSLAQRKGKFLPGIWEKARFGHDRILLWQKVGNGKSNYCDLKLVVKC